MVRGGSTAGAEPVGRHLLSARQREEEFALWPWQRPHLFRHGWGGRRLVPEWLVGEPEEGGERHGAAQDVSNEHRDAHHHHGEQLAAERA
eukprot:scaffold180332_cov30-Tisochrysis_lutea.AAC.2